MLHAVVLYLSVYLLYVVPVQWQTYFYPALSFYTNPNNARSSQKQPDNLDKILQAKVKLGKYLIEKYY